VAVIIKVAALEGAVINGIDGHTYAYRDGNCVDAVFTVACAADTVTVQVENRGDTPFAPNIRLTPADHRQLIIK
jgi:hypothetical protein